MMKKQMFGRAIIVFAIFSIMMLLTACGAGFSRKQVEGEEDRPFAYDAHRGTQGLDLQFLSKNPPTRVFYTGANPNSPLFTVMVEVRNKGTHTVGTLGPGYVYLSGYDPNIIDFQEDLAGQSDLLDFAGVSSFNPDGDYTVLEWQGYIGYGGTEWPVGADKITPKLKATACYPYRTIANPMVCVDPNPFSPKEDKSCRIKNIITEGGQGAPVVVSSVKQEATKEQLYFEINIRNAHDKGLAYDINRVTCSGSGPDARCCPSSLGYEDLNIIIYRVSLGQTLLTDCKPQYQMYTAPTNEFRIKMTDGKGKIYCSIENPGGTSEYETPLHIELDYGYETWDERQIEIKNVADETYT